MADVITPPSVAAAVPPPEQPTVFVPQESGKTKIIALWFILVCLVSVLTVVLVAFLTMSIVSNSILPDIIVYVSLFLNSSLLVAFSFMTVLSYKLSAAIHRLEVQAYQSARLLFLFNIIGSVITIIVSIVLKVGPAGIISSVFSMIVSGGLLLILASEKSRFVNEGKKSLWNMTLSAVVLLVIVSVTGLYLQILTQTQAKAALKELDQQVADERAKHNAEPEVKSWTTYTNNSFQFSMDLPQGWNVKEYPPDTAFGQESTLIGFSDKALPENRYEGIDSLHSYVIVFPVTAATDYQLYLKRMSQRGKDNFASATLGGVQGVDNGVTISVEHNGFVYEFYMKQQIDEKYNFTPSPLSTRMKDSFTFSK